MSHGNQRRKGKVVRDRTRNALATLEATRGSTALDRPIEVLVKLAGPAPVCEWFAGCGRPAAGTTPHRVLGLVLICAPCAAMFELPVTP